MVVDSEALKRSLEKKGFVMDESDHHVYRHTYKGKVTGIWTKVSHGARHDISNGLLSAVKKQMKLRSPNQVQEFAKCTLSEDAYNRILIEQKYFQA